MESVTYVDDHGAFVQDESGGTWFTFDRLHSYIEPGTVVALIGERAESAGEVCLSVKVMQVQFHSKLPEVPVTPIDKVTPQFESKRISVRGQLVDFQHAYESGRTELVLRNGERQFIVEVAADDSKQSTLDLATALELTVAGTITFAPHSRTSQNDFRMFMPSFDDVEVMSRKGIWDNRAVQFLSIVGSLLLLTCLLWGYNHRLSEAKTSRELNYLSAQLRSSYDSIRDGIIIVDRGHRIAAANRKAHEFFGFDFDANTSLERFEPVLLSRLKDNEFAETWRSHNRDYSASGEFECELTTPRPRILEVFTAPVATVGKPSDAVPEGDRIWVFYDVTERRKLQNSLVHSQKQEAAGQLAGGIAHDFNNFLTGISSNLFVARLDRSKTVDQVLPCLDAADAAAKRAADLVTKLLTFSQKNPLKKQLVCVNSVLDRMEPLLRPSLPNNILLAYDLDLTVPGIHADPIQLEQVLINICLNARDAIKEAGSKNLSPQGENSDWDRQKITVKTYSNDNGEVCVSVSDSGSGISEESMGRIFEPFFTTKGRHGTGLGLAMSHSIIHQHDGDIRVHSESGVGSEFIVALPAADSTVNVVSAPDTVDLMSHRVLVVDDEPSIRKLLVRVFEAEGMSVRIACDGNQAVEALSGDASDVDLVVLDWQLPSLSGSDVLKWLRHNKPHVPVIVCSGYVDSVARFADHELAPDRILNKPFSILELIETAKNAITQRRIQKRAARSDVSQVSAR